MSKTFTPQQPIRIGIIAGELSGDLLGAGLLKELKKRNIPFIAEGIGGPEMQAQGCHSLWPIEKLSIMGLGEILKQLPQLLKLRHQVIEYFISHPPDVFIGIDAPEFNLTIEEKLKQHGFTTVHYVSPSIWAWRPWRIKKIARAVDLMLTLFPFETPIYEKHQIPVVCVGHPLADTIPLEVDTQAARKVLNLPPDTKIIALLPGSRKNEIHYLGAIFLKTAQQCLKKNSKLIFVAAMANETIEKQFLAIKQQIAPELPLHLIQGQSRQVMAASDIILLASGTATLEAMLLKKPMIVAYRMSALSYLMAKALINVKYIALPNLIANRQLIPEFIQDQATPQNLSNAVCNYLNHPQQIKLLHQEFLSLHQQLRCQASERLVVGIFSKVLNLKT